MSILPKRVLLAEDDPLLRGLLEVALTREGFALKTCGDSLTLPAAIASFQPAIIVLDSGLPPGGGIPIFERLRKRGYLTPIILMASGHDDVLEEACRERPYLQYLAKPFSVQELLQAIARA